MPTILSYDRTIDDFAINGKSLKNHLAIHEKVNPKDLLPAFISQEGVVDRFAGKAEPDLVKGHVAIYVCSHCGGYDGNPVGVSVHFTESKVHWRDIGHHSDHAEGESWPFKKVQSLTFDRQQYEAFLKDLSVWAV